MLKILQVRLQLDVNCELPDCETGFRKGRGTRDQITNICWITEKEREFQKNIYFCFIDYVKVFDCVDHNKLFKIIKEIEILDRFTSLLSNLYAGQEATVRTRHATMDFFKIWKGVCQGCMFSPYLFNSHRVHHAKCWAVCITSWNQFYYEKYQHTDIILMAEIEDILKSLLRKMKEENEKNWLKTQHSRN